MTDRGNDGDRDRESDSVRLALLAHDLRTPLSAMRLTAELIAQGHLDENQSDQLAILIRSIDALNEMTGELVSAAKPGLETRPPPGRISDIVSETADLFRIAAEAKGLSYGLTAGADTGAFETRHGTALRRVVTTLLDNAVKYTGSGGIEVRVEAISEDGFEASETAGGPWIGISVSDTGPGIDPEERAELFRPFVRGRHGRETGPGTGLGLWGTAQLVREMGGRLLLSRPEGGGSRFEVRIPAGREGEASRSGPDAPAGPARVVAPGQIQAHVLIVDDNETNCRLLSALLESFGVSSETARSGQEAIALVAEKRFDAVLLDLHMPEMSGIETAAALRNLGNGADLALVAVTAALDSVEPDRLRRSGFQDVLAKPLSPAALYEVIEAICGSG
ncbi:hybrid sensor histidine kinase/response regulator [Roseibium aggregatum]|uniref:histidine kinase n=1 Tax=Roseibium aggregatum TaxID=187304 RepID=A0A939J4C1_9HYPH|nr:ATP-binding protein [Roseibium aggregatum]MBN9673408.1 response regulator [Roseibium aggregatum]